MADFDAVRASNPAYQNLSDVELATHLHSTTYNQIPFDDYVQQLGMTSDDFSVARSKNDAMGNYLREQAQVPRAGENMADREQRLYGSVGQREPVGTGEGMLRAGFQGATVGFGDEIVAGTAAALSDAPFDEAYEQYRGRERGDIERFREDEPVAAYGSEIAGSIPTMLATGIPGAGTGGFLARTGKSAAEAGMQGVAYGIGSGEGTAADHLENAAQTGSIASLVGGAAVPAVAGVKALVNSGKGLFGVGNAERVAQGVAQTAERSGSNIDDIARQLTQAGEEGQPMFTLADAMGDAGQRKLSGVARSGGDARELVSDAMLQRQAGQGERLGASISEATGTPDTAAQRLAKISGRRQEQANVNYGAAREGSKPVNLNSSLDDMDKMLGDRPLSELAPDAIERQLTRIKDQVINEGTGEQLVDFTRVFDLKRNLDDAASAAYRKGEGNRGEALKGLARQFDDSLAEASPQYTVARDTYRTQSGNIDAIETGADMARPRARATDTTATFGAATPRQQASMRSGYVEPVQARIEASAPGVNKARPLTSDKVARELEAMSIPGRGEKLNRQIGREQTMFETNQAALGGSKTADNLADMAESTGPSVGAVANVLRGRPAQAIAEVGQGALDMAKGENAAVRQGLAEALLATGDDAAAQVAAAVQAGKQLNAQESAIVKALMSPTAASVNK